MKYMDMLFVLLMGTVLLVPASLWFLSPDTTESQALLIGSRRFEPVLEHQPVSNYELAQKADALYQQGDVDQAVAIYESMDQSRSLEPDGLRKLAYYYAENGNYQSKYNTLFRLADEHLSADELTETASYFKAVNDSDSYFRCLEIKHQRSLNTLEDTLALARHYRHADHHQLAVGVVESLDVESLGRVTRDQFDLYLRSKMVSSSEEMLDREVLVWFNDSLDLDILADRVDVLIDNDLDELVRSMQLQHVPIEIIAGSRVESTSGTGVMR